MELDINMCGQRNGNEIQRKLYSNFIFLFADEEVGGQQGMESFVKHSEFQKLNIGFALDEGK